MFVQIVKFKLKPDSSRESFLELTEQMVAWLKIQDGFIAYELYEGSEFWSDRIAWNDQSFAQEGLKEFLSTAIAKNLVHLVKDGHSSFFGQSVVSSQREAQPVVREGLAQKRASPST